MDELCLHWGQVAERRHGGVLRHHGMDTAGCCVILAATADGNLLPPFLVIKVTNKKVIFFLINESMNYN